MKRFLYLTLMIFLSSEACAYFRASCPKTECSFGTFMGDNGKCYNCDEKKDIFIECIGKEKILADCSNRIVVESCGTYSRLCPKNTCSNRTFMGDDGKCYNCDEDKIVSINCLGKEVVKKICPNRVVSDCVGILLSEIYDEKRGSRVCDCID